MRVAVLRRSIGFGVDYIPPATHMPRHQHAEAYATLVLHGAFEQTSYAGRLRLQPGDVLIQPTLDCHSDHMLSPGVALIRFPWPREATLGCVHRDCRIDLVQRVAERDICEARALLAEELVGRTPVLPTTWDWPDLLAADLAANPRLPIAQWASSKGLTREHVSRYFRSVYGATPTQFRLELAARAAWLQITGSADPLSRIAANLGFADQAHMTRAVKALTGAPPTRWRTSHLFKTASTAEPKLQL
jgi:AraC-like DNA-binding protein